MYGGRNSKKFHFLQRIERRVKIR
ncbi:hypothetical protein F383_37278 [Gossypium arboreum]|uniref:Uncharacterized protein n=2 Tax=Gossypium arboreum TaxID=29729 RepID=A0A0B0MEX3_GOSAR|nr:hypothetical protein F383_37278 [Gossypium arboreum]